MKFLTAKSTLPFLGLLGLFTFLSLSSTSLMAQEDGEKLFKSYCASCHSAGNNQLVGPGWQECMINTKEDGYTNGLKTLRL